MPNYSKNILMKVILDLICLLTVGIPILVLYLAGKPYKRGFYCNDESIRYPFEESTITNNVLYCVGIGLPTIVIVSLETYHYFKGTSNQRHSSRKFLRWNVHPLVWDIYIKLGVFAFGACLSQLTTDIAKYTIGRLRPHFYFLCNPNIDCNDSENKYKYHVDDFVCQGAPGYDNEFNLKEMRLSFPSGHASFSAYAMVYIVLFLQVRMTCRVSKLLRPFLQALALWANYYTALSRVSNYKHHWSDVLVGLVIGVVTALLVVFFISDLFGKSRRPASVNDKYVEDGTFAEVVPTQPQQCS